MYERRSKLSNRQQTELIKFFADDSIAAQICGDASSFLGEPFFGFGDAWDAVAPNITDAIPRYLNLALMSQTFYTPGSHTPACYLDFPKSDSSVFARMAVAKDDAGASLVTSYPAFAGYPAKVTIRARFDWENGVCGFIAAAINEGPLLNFFVPGYGHTRERFIPGEERAISVAGLALSIEKSELTSFSVHQGPFYEMEMERFLEENPGKSSADFKAPVIRLDGCVITSPTDTTCFYSILAPVQEISEVSFDGRTFYRLLMPIARSTSEEEILAYVYANKEHNAALQPAEGDVLQCYVWLCTDICE